MKGGGIVLLVIFVFLFICFVWGISSVVGNVRNAIQSKQTRSKDADPDKPISSLSSKQMPKSSESAASKQSDPHQATSHPLEESAARLDAMARTLEHLQKITEMHQQGILTDQEFAKIKSKLIQEI